MKKRVVVLGLDGVPYSLLIDLVNRGIMPYMKTLCQEGSLRQIEASIPAISSVSWTTFVTGVNPGEHGIYGFMDFRPGTYEMYFPNATNVKASTIWQDLAKRKKRSVVINLPATYPAQPIKGALISGFVAIDLQKAVYPASYLPSLQEMGYKIDLDLVKARQDPDYLSKELIQTLEGRKKAVDLLWYKEDWDLFILVITGTDRLHHFQFDSYFDESHPYHERFLDYYQRVDALIEGIHKRYQADCHPESIFLMLSDHGFTSIKSEVYINRLLHENGFLNFSSDNPTTIQEIGNGTKAFAMDPSRIYVNLKSKYPNGFVNKQDYETVIKELESLFSELSFNKEPVIHKILTRDQIYSGPQKKYGPDLILLSHDGFDLKGMVTQEHVFGNSELKGMHTQNNAFCYLDRPKVNIGHIQEMKRIILDGYE